MLRLEYKGRCVTIGEISLETGKNPASIYQRLVRGGTVKDCLLPSGEHKEKMKFEYEGYMYTVKELAEMAHVHVSTIYKRLYKYSTIKEVLGFK